MSRLFNLFLILVFSINTAWAQAPKKFDFVSPLNIPLILSGTFGELRSNHFHTGLDIKTKGRIGFDVKAIGDGYISRINVSPYGYGKAIYITHPNGYTSVYAHLNNFSPEIEKLIKTEQYKKKRYSISVYPKKDEIKVLKNQVIAKSGNTGGSAGPHLHFEIRDTKTQRPQNPFNFGYKVKDNKKPTIRTAFVYSFDNNREDILSLEKIRKNNSIDTISVPSGWVGLGVDSYDRLDNARNKNGVYSVKLFVDNTIYFEYKMDELNFNEQRYINSFIDYAYYKDNKRRIQKLFLDPGNKLNLYDSIVNNGYLKIERNKYYPIKILVEDYKGNKTIDSFLLKGEETKRITSNKSKIIFDYSKDNLFETNNFRIKIPKGALYKNANFYYSYSDSIYHVGDSNIPLQKSCSIDLKISNKNDSLANKMIIVSISDRGYSIYSGGKIKDGYISTKTRNFGKYKISYDTISPTITPINIRKGKWMSKDKYLTVKIKDDISGIKSYKGEIDGRWIRMAYNAKKGTLKYNFKDLKLKGEKHTFTIVVKDNVNNTTEYKVLFYRKD